jgi:anti-sigma factor RsiW
MNKELLWDYADGLLSPSECREVEALLEKNPSLTIELQGIMQQKAAFSSLPLTQTPSSFAPSVMAAWQQEQTARVVFSTNWMVRGIVGFLVLSLLVSCGLLYFSASNLPKVTLPPLHVQYLPNFTFLQPLFLLFLGALTANFAEQVARVFFSRKIIST